MYPENLKLNNEEAFISHWPMLGLSFFDLRMY